MGRKPLPRPVPLTERELQCLRVFAQWGPTKAAAELGVSKSALLGSQRRVMEKLEVWTVKDMLQIARQQGLLEGIDTPRRIRVE